MNKIAICTLIILVIALNGYGQKFDYGKEMSGNTLKQIVKSAEDAIQIDKDYYTAMVRYQRAREIKPKEVDYAYKYAEAARLGKSYTRAQEGYQDVVNMRTEGTYPLTEFWLAHTKQLLGKYTEAVALFDKFIEEQTGNEEVASYYLQRAKKERASSLWSRDIAEEQHNVEVEHIGEEINTPGKEFGAFIVGDTLFYSSLNFESRKDNEPTERAYSRIMYSVNGQEGVQLMNGINDTTRHTANLAYNAERTIKVFTRCNYLTARSVEIRCQIYIQKKQADGRWSNPELLPSDIQQKDYTYTHPSIGRHNDNGKEYLYYVSDQGNEEGKLDIWTAELLEDGSFGTPENLEVVNTKEDEITPFFHTPSQTLYYSTEGQRGLGGFDIHKITRSAGEWLEAENMGKPVNSSLNDISFTLNEAGDKGYFASNREGSVYLDKEFELCCDDLYAAEFDIKVELLVNTFDGNTFADLEGATVRLLEVKPDGSIVEIAKLTNSETNDFVFYGDRGKKYILEASREGYVQQLEELDIPLDAPEQIKKEIYLNPITVDLKALTYDMDTELPLSGVTVQIIELQNDGTERVVQEQFNDFGNDFLFPLEREKVYVIRATKSGYKPLEELQLSTEGLTQPEVFLAELYLKRNSFTDYLPLAIYFDNDYPDVDSRSRTTNTDYAQTIDDYLERKEEYKLLFAEPMEEEEAFLTAQRYEQFFEREVRKGYEDLVAFAEVLIPFLERGNEVRLSLQGYASPRAEDQYNYNLSARRIVSVENFFRSYKGGVLMQYVNNENLTFETVPHGETRTNFFTDLIEDERNSIYSLGASLERRVEILEVEVRVNDDDTDFKTFSSKGGKK
ncbi:MAG: hypothetical protein AAF849_19615 [Bacteroidota bacterium]